MMEAIDPAASKLYAQAMYVSLFLNHGASLQLLWSAPDTSTNESAMPWLTAYLVPDQSATCRDSSQEQYVLGALSLPAAVTL